MKNLQLQQDIEKLLSYDDYCYSDITTDYDENLGFILDIKDNSYFYENEADRNLDDSKIMKLLEEKFYI
ncbi:MAG: hypothetical protein H7Y10_03480 [Flavobacterium sp.]|nr:hypothetical protein [Flavobacterium sp.]